ncbi:MAG: M28 family peptidase [Cytophagales bacterium]|nr:M28 family peptidase [Cytophagales bacterium]
MYNVVGTLVGSENPDQWIIAGAHYDAWAFGATDPNSGTAMLLALSESLGKLSQAGQKA